MSSRYRRIGTSNNTGSAASRSRSYTNDKGPSGADTVGVDERDVELYIKTSNFGATIELDQNVYTWTDKVFITDCGIRLQL